MESKLGNNGEREPLQEWFERKLAFSPVVFAGRGIFQYNWGIVPFRWEEQFKYILLEMINIYFFRRPLTVVVGAPITVPKIENPTQEEVMINNVSFWPEKEEI